MAEELQTSSPKNSSEPRCSTAVSLLQEVVGILDSGSNGESSNSRQEVTPNPRPDRFDEAQPSTSRHDHNTPRNES